MAKDEQEPKGKDAHSFVDLVLASAIGFCLAIILVGTIAEILGEEHKMRECICVEYTERLVCR